MRQTEINFVKYVALLKTIRGVLLSKHAFDEQIKKWLRRSIRWRPVGINNCMLKVLKKSGFSSKLIKKLAFPFSCHKEVANIIAESIDACIAEIVIRSSIYIVPILILNREDLKALRKSNLITYEICTDKKISDKQIKLHMRIAEYSMKDYNFDIIKNAEEAIISGDLRLELERRKKLCVKDSRRYWRIKRESGDTVIVYIDPLRALKDKTSTLGSLVKKDEKTKMCFGIPVGLVIPNLLKK